MRAPKKKGAGLPRPKRPTEEEDEDKEQFALKAFVFLSSKSNASYVGE